MNNEKKIESIKYRLNVANHQKKIQVINDEAYQKILNSLEKEVRDLEDKIFNDTEERRTNK